MFFWPTAERKKTKTKGKHFRLNVRRRGPLLKALTWKLTNGKRLRVHYGGARGSLLSTREAYTKSRSRR